MCIHIHPYLAGILGFESAYWSTLVSVSSVTSAVPESTAGKLSGWEGKCELLALNRKGGSEKKVVYLRGRARNGYSRRVSLFTSSALFFFCTACLEIMSKARDAGNGAHSLDDNDEVSSHPANESPDLPGVCLLCKFFSHRQWIKGRANQCFFSQYFSQAITHKGHDKGTHTHTPSTHGGIKKDAILQRLPTSSVKHQTNFWGGVQIVKTVL